MGITLGRRTALALDLGEAAIAADARSMRVVLAVPPWVAKDLNCPTLDRA